MSVIGLNDLTGVSTTGRTTTDTHKIMSGGSYSFVAGADEEVFRLGVYATTNGGTDTLQLGLYDITGGVSGATLVASGTVTINLSTPANWYIANITPVTLTNGNTYAVAVGTATSFGWQSRRIGSSGAGRDSTSATQALDASFVDNATYGYAYALYAETRPVVSMAAPISLTKYASSAASTTHTITLPTVAEDDLLLVMFSYRGTGGVTWDNSAGYFEELTDQGQSTVSGAIYIRRCTGSESGATLTATLASSYNAVCLIYRIAGASGRVERSLRVGSSSNTANPDVVNAPAPWGAQDYLAIAFAQFSMTGETINSYPTGYSGGDSAASTAGSLNVHAAVAYKILDGASSEDPDGFVASTTAINNAWVLLIEPSRASAGFAKIRSSVQSKTTTNGTAHSVTMPSFIKNGDELHAFLAWDGNPVLSGDFDTWTLESNTTNGTGTRFYHYKKVADGTEEADSLSVTSSTSEMGLYNVLAVATAGSEDVTPATGDSASPDSPSITPSWGAANTLVLSVMSGDNGATVTTFSPPVDYGIFVTQHTTAGTGNALLAYAAKEITGSSEDPGMWAMDLSEQWIATTVAFRAPSTAASNEPAYVQPLAQRNYRKSGRFIGR